MEKFITKDVAEILLLLGKVLLLCNLVYLFSNYYVPVGTQLLLIIGWICVSVASQILWGK